MEDDLTFGVSVWGAPDEPLQASSSSAQLNLPAVPLLNTVDEFDDFGDPAPTKLEAGTKPEADTDDFGDFGDAEGAVNAADFGEVDAFGEEVRITAEGAWKPLQLDPMPSRTELKRQMDDILGPMWVDDISQLTTEEDIRQVEGISQILISPESRDLYNSLFQSQPPMKPPNWTRSRIRRQHLIALGIPVNLDEVLPYANGKPLPPLQITTRPTSAPPGHGLPNINAMSGSSRSRSGTPQPTNIRAGPSNASQLGLGPKPELDEGNITELLSLDAETLTLLPLSTLESHLKALRTQTLNTSTLLTHLLQTREALRQDSETYNGLIAELVGEAQKIKTVKGRSTSMRGSGIK